MGCSQKPKILRTEAGWIELYLKQLHYKYLTMTRHQNLKVWMTEDIDKWMRIWWNADDTVEIARPEEVPEWP